MRQEIDRLDERCGSMLSSEERIIRSDESSGWKAPLMVLGGGRLYLTNRRIIWLRRGWAAVRRIVFWIPDEIAMPLHSVRDVRVTKQSPMRRWLRLRADSQEYAFMIGKGPYPLLRDQAFVAESWLVDVEQARRNALD